MESKNNHIIVHTERSADYMNITYMQNRDHLILPNPDKQSLCYTSIFMRFFSPDIIRLSSLF